MATLIHHQSVAQSNDSIGLAKTISTATFILDFKTNELINANFRNYSCSNCPNIGQLYSVERVPSDGDLYFRKNIRLVANDEIIMSYFYEPYPLYDKRRGDDFFFPERMFDTSKPKPPFTFQPEKAQYGTLPNNMIKDIEEMGPYRKEGSQRIIERLDSTWAMVSSSAIVQEFMKLPNYHVTFRYYTYTYFSPFEEIDTSIPLDFIERWMVMVHWADGTTSTNLAQQPQIQVFPNPTSQFTKVEVKGLNPNETTVLKLFNLNGKLITSQSFQTNEVSTQFDLTNLPNGIYSLHIQNSNSYKTSKIIKI